MLVQISTNNFFFSISLCWKFRRSQTCFVYTLIFGYPSYLFWASPHPFWASPVTFELLPIPFELLPIPFELLPNTSELFTTLSSFSPILLCFSPSLLSCFHFDFVLSYVLFLMSYNIPNELHPRAPELLKLWNKKVFLIIFIM